MVVVVVFPPSYESKINIKTMHVGKFAPICEKYGRCTSGAKIVKIGFSHGKKCQRQRFGFVLWSLNAQM
jgi:hypothetical protein